MNKRISVATVICVFALTRFGTPVRAADTPATDCFKPFTPQTKMLEFKAKKPPYRVALANGYIGNTWRIEMIKCLEAYAQDPEIKPLIKELKIVSTGTDVAAQIGAVDNFINAGYDVVLINAVSSTAFKPVIERAKRAGVLLISYDNTIDSDQIGGANKTHLEVGGLVGRGFWGEMGRTHPPQRRRRRPRGTRQIRWHDLSGRYPRSGARTDRCQESFHSRRRRSRKRFPEVDCGARQGRLERLVLWSVACSGCHLAQGGARCAPG